MFEQDEAKRQKIRAYTERWEAIKSERASFNDLWDRVAKVVRPDAASFVATYNHPGQRVGQDLYDGTGVHANQLLAAGFFSLLTNPQTKWFELISTNPELRDNRDVQIWLKDCSDLLLTEMQRPQTGFSTSLQECYLDYSSFGNCILYTTYDEKEGRLQYVSLPLQESYFLEGPNGQVEALYRTYKRKLYQAVDYFGAKAVAKEVIDRYEQGAYKEDIEILHIIEPNASYVALPGQINLRNINLPFRETYIDLTHQHIIREGGYFERPFCAARFFKTSYEVYGRGPGCTALADLQTLQEVMKTTIKSAQKATDPPLIVPDEEFIHVWDTSPGGVSYYRPDNPNDKVLPLLGNAQPQWGFETANDIRNRIRNMFFVDQLQLSEGPQMTATEVIQRTEEKMRLLGPQVARAMTELLSPTVHRSFAILYRAGAFGPEPSVLQDYPPSLKVAYLSPFAKALDQTEANSILRVTQLISPFMSVDAQVMDIFDTDQVARRLAEMYAIDPRCIRTAKDVEALRQQRAEQAQQQQMMDMMSQGGSGFKDMAQGAAELIQLTGGGSGMSQAGGI